MRSTIYHIATTNKWIVENKLNTVRDLLIPVSCRNVSEYQSYSPI